MNSLLASSAARLKESGKPFVTDAAIAKLRASEVAEKVTSLCVKCVLAAKKLGPFLRYLSNERNPQFDGRCGLHQRVPH